MYEMKIKVSTQRIHTVTVKQIKSNNQGREYENEMLGETYLT